jgi:hypothetical protein
MNTTIETTLTQNIFRILLSILWSMQDSVIYFNRVDFQAQVPDWLPLSKDLVVLLSGSRNSLVLAGKGTSNIWLGTCVILRFVFPGNIAQYLDQKMLLRFKFR